MKIVDEVALDNAIVSLADAIRSRGHFSSKMTFPDGFISAISSGTFYSGQKKYIMPQSIPQMITPDNGYDAITEAVVYGDANLIPSNVEAGVSIFGVTGTYDGDIDDFLNGTLVTAGGKMNQVPSHFYQSNTSLEYVNLYNCKTIGESAFCQCDSLKTVSIPSCEVIDKYAFYACDTLSKLYAPNCSYISDCTFSICTELSNVDITNVETIGPYAFAICDIRYISLPFCKILAKECFGANLNLSWVELLACESIGIQAFYSCWRLMSVYLYSPSVPSLVNINAFGRTPIGGYTFYTGGISGSIYVPSSLYSEYIVATNWSYFSSRIVSI